MHAGELRHRVDLQQATVLPDAHGAPVRTWSTVATVWAAIEPVTGRQYYEAKAVGIEQPVRVRVRHRADVTTGMRVRHGARAFDIESVQDVGGLGRELVLLTRAIDGVV